MTCTVQLVPVSPSSGLMNKDLGKETGTRRRRGFGTTYTSPRRMIYNNLKGQRKFLKIVRLKVKVVMDFTTFNTQGKSLSTL